MDPPKPQPIAPKTAKYGTRLRQSSRPQNKEMAIAHSAPAIIAPYSYPKFPRIPQPIESASIPRTTEEGLNKGLGATQLATAVVVDCMMSLPKRADSERTDCISLSEYLFQNAENHSLKFHD